MPEQTQLPPGPKLNKLVAEAMGWEVKSPECAAANGKFRLGPLYLERGKEILSPMPLYSITPEGAAACANWLHENGFTYQLTREYDPGDKKPFDLRVKGPELRGHACFRGDSWAHVFSLAVVAWKSRLDRLVKEGNSNEQ